MIRAVTAPHVLQRGDRQSTNRRRVSLGSVAGNPSAASSIRVFSIDWVAMVV